MPTSSGTALRKQNHGISSPASYAAPPGRKTHNPIPPPRPLACGGVLTCLINLHTVMRKSVA